MTVRTIYLEELNSLRKSVAEMGEAVEASFDMLLTAVDSKDEDLEMQIIRGDRVINDMERSIESKCLSLITRQQPIAVHAFVTRNSDAANEVIRHDDVVDSLFAKVKDDLVYMLQEGVDNIDACVDVLMIAKYLERIGDHAVNIAEWEIFQESGSIKDIRLM